MVLLAALSDSLDWLGDVISQLGSGGMTSSSVVSPVTSPLQERERARARRAPPLSAQHRRGSSQTLTSGLAILADKFHNLSVEFVRTLRLEMQLQTAYHFQVGGGGSAPRVDYSCVAGVGLVRRTFVRWKKRLQGDCDTRVFSFGKRARFRTSRMQLAAIADAFSDSSLSCKP